MTRRIITSCIALTVGAIHFIKGENYEGPFPIFGSTFDPLDIIAYAGGILLGVLLDLILFPRFVPRWLEQ